MQRTIKICTIFAISNLQCPPIANRNAITMFESVNEVVKTKISMHCKYCANFHGSIANIFWHRISDHFYWSKEHIHQVWKLYPKMHYFAIFEGLQTLLTGTYRLKYLAMRCNHRCDWINWWVATIKTGHLRKVEKVLFYKNVLYVQ